MRTLAPQSDQSSIIQYEQFHSTVMSTRWVYTCGCSQSPSVIVKRLKKMTPPKKDTFDPTEGFPSSLFLGILISSCCSCLDYRFTLGSSARRHLPLWSCEDSETLCPPPPDREGAEVALQRLKWLCLRRGAPSIWLFGKDKVLLLMKSRCDMWELGNRWDARSPGASIAAPPLTIHGLVSYAREWGKMS